MTSSDPKAYGLEGEKTGQAAAGKRSAVYTCNEYRAEMILLGLNRQLANPDLTDAQRDDLKARIAAVEKEMGLD